MYIQKSKVFSLEIQMLTGFIFTCVLGILLHSLYSWTGKSPVLAAIVPINESPWEHLKMLFFPILLFYIIQSLYLKYHHISIPNLAWFSSLSALLAMTLTTVTYYTYRGIFGINASWFNIVIFFASAACAYYYNFHMLKTIRVRISLATLAGGLLFLLLAAALVGFTYFAPAIPWFQDPSTGQTGILL